MESFLQVVSKISKKNAQHNIVGVVTVIEGNTCSVQPEGLALLTEVRLNAIEGNFNNSICIYPKVGSQVVCVPLDGIREETCIIQYSEIDRIHIKIDGAELELKGGKIKIENTETSQKELMNELLATLKTAIILTPQGPGKFSEPTKLKLEQIKIKNNQLYE